MLVAVGVTKNDVVYDLGSGDGRVVIGAAKNYGCRAVGLELDSELVKLARERAKEAKVDHLVTIKEADIFSADFSEATVVAVYLYPGLLNRLYPKLQELKPGSRIVSHQFVIPNYPPEQTIIVGSQETGAEHKIYLWTAGKDEREIRRFHTADQGAIRVAISPNGEQALSGGTDGTVRLWDVQTGKELRKLVGHTGQTYTVAFSPSGQLALSGGDDNQLLLWDLTSGEKIRNFVGHEGTVASAMFSPDGKQIASGSWDRTIRIWNVATGEESIRLQGHTHGIMGVAYSPDGKLLASAGGEDRSVRVWEVDSGKESHKLLGHTAMVRAVAFAGSGKRILSGAYTGDGTARLWDLETGKEVRSMSNIAAGIHGVALSPDGRRAIVVGDDQAELWDLERNILEQTFEGLDVGTDAVFLPDSKQALLGSLRDNTLRLWRLPPITRNFAK
jgi:WD40 repeat protein